MELGRQGLGDLDLSGGGEDDERTKQSLGKFPLTGPDAVNVLGHRTALDVVGSRGDPSSGAGAGSTLPAPSGPGGTSGGFLGGRTGSGASGGATALDKLIASLGGASKVSQLLNIPESALGVRGGTPGEGGTITSDQSLSDRLRSGDPSLTSNVGDLTAAGLNWEQMLELGGPNPTLSTAGPSSPMSGLDALRENLPPGGADALASGAAGGVGTVGGDSAVETLATGLGTTPSALASSLGMSVAALGALVGGFGLYQGIESGSPTTALGGAYGLYSSAATAVNALAGETILPTLSTLVKTLGLSIAPELAAEAAATTAAAGAGAATVGIAMAPIAAAYLAASINDMFEAKENMNRAAGQFKELTGELPGVAAQIQSVPQLVQMLNGATPDEARVIYDKLQYINQNFSNSGMENFLRTGATSSSYGSSPNTQAIMFPQGAEIYTALQPGLGALGVGIIRAQDIMARGGMAPPPGAWSPETAALQMGAQMYDTGGGTFSKRYNPYLAKNYSPGEEALAMQTESQNYLATHPEDPQGLGYADWQAQQLMSPGRTWTEHQGVWGAPTPTWSERALADFATIQPGELEQGLYGLFQTANAGATPGPAGQGVPQTYPWDFGRPASAPGSVGATGPTPQQALDQQRSGIVQGAFGPGVTAAAPGEMAPAGVLSDDDLRKLGLVA